MRLKKYIFFSIVLMLLVGGFVYSQIDRNYTFEILGIPISLPVAVWIVIPMFIMFLASFFHMAYYSFKNFMVLKKYRKDYDKMVDAVAASLMREPRDHNYKTQEARNLGNVIDHSDIVPREFRIETRDERLKKSLEYIKDIQNGIYVEIDNFQLSPRNPLLVKNIENRLKEEPTYSGVVLRNCKEYPIDLCRKSLKVYMGFSDIGKIKEYVKLFNKELLFYLIDLAAREDGALKPNYDDILYIIQEMGERFGAQDYIDLARKVKEIMSPDERLKLFELLKVRDEKAEGGYLYTLFDLEMIEKAKEFFETTHEEEWLNFKAYLELKECGRNYPLELFI
ncbi:MAG: hypothetical protein GXO19_00880 [Epsilonproteobacteria bacterium]|nr:hypothetical protein [Campylobacterota bacterium]NPA56267.1 hypothetical protein [Campylobacterota bacterium]